MMLPDCMQGPSEPCAGYTAQSASIAALEAELLEHTLMWYAERKRREDAEAELAERTRERDSWRRVAERLERGVQRRAQAPFGAETKLAEWKKEAHLLADKLMERDAECIAERERREAAEALLHEVDKDWVAMGYAGWLEFNKRLLAHFAHYKD